MKKCPRCNDFSLYNDSNNECPLCGATLVAYSRNSRMSDSNNGQDVFDYETENSFSDMGEPIQPVRPTRNLNQSTQQGSSVGAGSNTSQNENAPTYVSHGLFTNEYRGLVLEVNNRTRHNNRLKKWVNTIFRGEPYQFGHTTQESTIRIEEFVPGQISGRVRDFIIYGDIEGRVYPGDDVTVLAKKRSDRYIITKMYSNQTQTPIKVSAQIPAWVIWLVTLLIAYLLFGLVTDVVVFITSGALRRMVDNLISIVVAIVVIVIIFRMIFGRRL